MNRRTCANCQSSWYSLADHELEAPHTCPRCGDQLSAIAERPVEVQPKSPALAQPRR